MIEISCVNLRKGYKRQAQDRTQSLKSELVQKNESAKFFYLHSIAEYHTSVVPQISKTKFFSGTEKSCIILFKKFSAQDGLRLTN